MTAEYSGHVGAVAEDLAVDFLRLGRYTILARNYQHRKAEIDIIARKGDTIVFVEVKLRKVDPQGASPFEAVDTRKQKHIVRAALHYASTQFGHGVSLRFDVIGLTLDQDQGVLNMMHLENAFQVDLKYFY